MKSNNSKKEKKIYLARNDDLLSLLACGLASVLADWLALQDSGLLSAGVHAAVLAGRLARIAVVVVLASARLLALILAGLRASLRNRNHFELFLADGVKGYGLF